MMWDRFEHPFLIELVRKTDYMAPEELAIPYSYQMKADEEYNLPYSLLSSYGCYFFEPSAENNHVNPYHWKGIIPPFTDINLIQLSPKEILVYSENDFSSTLLDYLKEAIGLWDRKISLPQEDYIKKINELYPGLRVPRLQENLLDLLISILCSQHTRVENARRWFFFLKRYYRRVSPILEMDPYEVMNESKKVSGKSIGYRARYIKETLAYLNRDGCFPEEKLRRIINKDQVEESRRELINIKFVGPKTADCLLLNALGDVNVPPVDVNVKRVCERIDSKLAGMTLPKIAYCRKYICDSNVESCPYYLTTQEVLEDGRSDIHSGCLRAALKIKFEKPGWIQALLFLFGLEFCTSKKPACDNCFIKDVCKGPQRIFQRKVNRFSSRIIRKTPSIKKVIVNLLELYPDKEELIREDAIKIFKGAKAVRMSGNKQTMMAASYWIAARKRRVPLTLRETAKGYGLKNNVLFKQIKNIKRLLPIAIPLLHPKDYVFPLGRKMGLDNRIIEKAEEIASKYDTPGRSPIGIAASSLYLSAQKASLKLSLKEVSRISEISEVTIRKNNLNLSQILAPT